jgi:hypothetical protein
MRLDSRLTHTGLLTLAAYRLQQRRQHQVPDWRHSEGLASLLAASRALPRRSPWDLPDLDIRSGLGRLLAEARAWQQEVEGGA